MHVAGDVRVRSVGVARRQFRSVSGARSLFARVPSGPSNAGSSIRCRHHELGFFFFFLHVHCVNPCVARCPGVFDHRGNKTIGKKNYIFFIVNFFFIVDPCVCVKCIKIGQNTIYLFILKLPRIRWKKIKIFKYV